MNNELNNNNGGPDTGTNGKYDFFPPDNNVNNNQGMQPNNNINMGVNQNITGNVNNGTMQNMNTGVNYMNSGNNAMDNTGMNNVGMNNGINSTGMNNNGMNMANNQGNINNNMSGANFNMQQQNPMMNNGNQMNGMQNGMIMSNMPQPVRMGYGNPSGPSGVYKKGSNIAIIGIAAVAVVIVGIILVALVSSGGNKLTCTNEDEIDGAKLYTKMEVKVSKGGHKAVVKTEKKYEFEKLEDEDMYNIFASVDIYGGSKQSPNYDKFKVDGTSEIGKSSLGDNTVIKRKGNTVTITAETSEEDDDDKIEKEDIEELKESLESIGMTCK